MSNPNETYRISIKSKKGAKAKLNWKVDLPVKLAAPLLTWLGAVADSLKPIK